MSLPLLLSGSLLSGLIAFFLRGFCWRTGLVEADGPPMRYAGAAAFSVSLISSGVVFLFQWNLAWVLYIGVFVALSVIDYEEKVLPHKVWYLGAILASGLSWIFPSLTGGQTGLEGVLLSGLGAVAGGGIIFFMVELGKILFGKLEIEYPAPKSYRVCPVEGVWSLISDEESMPLREIFMRKHDVMTIENSDGSTVKLWETLVDFGGGKEPLSEFCGEASKAVVPREAMGFGDVKFMVMAGAMLGWEGAIFAIFAGAVLGSVIGLATKMLHGKNEIPFIPFLAAGAIAFMIFAPDVRETFGIIFLK